MVRECSIQSLDREVFPLGFGTAWIRPDGGDRLIRSAIESGIQYFDTARMYAGGEAEVVLGTVLSALSNADRDRLVIATKLGIFPPSLSLSARIARKLATKLGQQPPAFARARRGAFSVEDIENSLSSSLRALRTDHVDILLLHGLGPDELGDDAVAYLAKAKAAGKFHVLGIASGIEDSVALLRDTSALYDVVQIPASLWDDNLQRLPPTKATKVTHSAFVHHFAELKKRLASDAALAGRWSSALDVDINEPGVIGSVLMRHALSANPDGIVLFSTNNEKNLSANMEVADYPPFSSEKIAALEKLAK